MRFRIKLALFMGFLVLLTVLAYIVFWSYPTVGNTLLGALLITYGYYRGYCKGSDYRLATVKRRMIQAFLPPEEI